MGQASSAESPGRSPGPTGTTGDPVLSDTSQRQMNWSPTPPPRTTTEIEPTAKRGPNTSQERPKNQVRSTEISTSSTINLGSFNPRGAYSRDFPHVEFQSRVRIMGRKDMERAQTQSSTTEKPFNPLLDQSGKNKNGKRAYSTESNPDIVQHLQDGHPATQRGIKRLPEESRSFTGIGSTSDATMEKVNQDHDLFRAADLQEHGEVMLLQCRSSLYEWNRSRPLLKIESSPRFSSTFFSAVIPEGVPNDPLHNSSLPNGLKGIGATNRKIEEECVARSGASKPSLEALMLENGLQHPQRSHTRTSTKSPSLMDSQVVKSDTDTEKGDDNIEGTSETVLEDQADEEDDEELELQYEYFVTTRWWDADGGEANAWEEFSPAFAARNDANSYAFETFKSKVRSLIASDPRDNPKQQFTCGTKDGLISLRLWCGQVGATTEVERNELWPSPRPPPEAVWIPREAYVVSCITTRIELREAESLELQRERLSALQNEAKPLSIVTSLPRANSAASAMYFDMRTNQDGGMHWDELFKENVRSDLYFEVRYLSKEHFLFEKIWNHAGLSYKISVEKCKVQGPRN